MSVVLITGCGSGMGAATALHLAQNGDHVFAGMRRPESAADLQAIAARDCLSLSVLVFDVTSPNQVITAVEKVISSAGRIDALVNNAGMSLGWTALEETSDEDAKSIFELNFFSPLRLIRAVLPTMRAQRSGTIVNVSAMASVAPRPYLSIYSASKGALDAVSFSLAAEVREFGIRVVVIAPGSFRTESHRKWTPPSIDTGVERYRAVTTQKREETAAKKSVRGGDPKDVAKVIGECLHADNPPIRLFVGDDSQRLASQRRAQTDEEYVLSLGALLEVPESAKK